MKNYNRDNSSGRERGFNRGGSRDSRRPEMFEATCNSCGDACEVPFKPSGSKPIYCSSCFEKNQNESPRRSSGRDRDRRDQKERSFGGRNSNRTTMHKTTCDKCGSECEVPFRPTAGKPVYCDNCFGHTGSNKEKDTELLKKEIEIINNKLDKILEALASVLSEKKDLEKEAKVKEEIEEPKKKTKKTIKTAVKKASSAKKTSASKTVKKKPAASKKVAKKKE